MNAMLSDCEDSSSAGSNSPALCRFKIPSGPDPFVNTPLLPLGEGPDGQERFWISSYNSNVGCLGAMVTESGRERIYRFDSTHRGFYGAIQEDADTLWLCGDLSRVVRLSLGTGEYESFDTGAPAALVFQGLRFDPETGKLFAAAYVQGVKTFGFSFDCRNRRTARIYETDCQARYTRGSFPNGDGSYTILVAIPELVLLHWKPREETLESFTFSKPSSFTQDKNDKLSYGRLQRLITDENGKVYLPELGWYDSGTRGLLATGPHPDRDANWFARDGHLAWGLAEAVANDPNNKILARWDLRTGHVENLCTTLDTGHGAACLTKAGKVVCVTIYGEFRRFDANTGALEIAKKLPTDSIARVDCLVRVQNRLLGTPFITQRFWEIDLNTAKGHDCGRAAPGEGQIVKVWEMGGHVYMAAYTGGELVKYDPAQAPRFPENPRVVADPPGGMRPIAAAHSTCSLYYSCSLAYGRTGSVLTKYNTTTGEASYRNNPIPNQMIFSLHFDAGANGLIAGTTIHADSQSRDPDSKRPHLALFHADDLSVIEKAAGPDELETVAVVGALGGGEYLCSASRKHGATVSKRSFQTSIKKLSVPEWSAMKPFPKDMEAILWTGKSAIFILRIRNCFELWDMREWRVLSLLFEPGDLNVHGWHVQNDSVYFVTPKEIIILENCLTEF